MSVVVYPAVLTAAEGALQARFVDLPGLEVSAASQAELIRLARERLAADLQRRAQAEEPWPEPTGLAQVGAPAGGSVLLVDVSVDDTPVRLTISLGERLLKRIDQDAEARSMTRSGYLALGARRLLGEAAQPGEGVTGETGRRLQEEMASLGRRVTEAMGPDSPVGRTLAELDAIALDGLRRLGGEMQSAFKASGRDRRNASPEPATAAPVADPEPKPATEEDPAAEPRAADVTN